MTLLRNVLATVLVATAVAAPVSVLAGQRDIQVLQSYVGDWKGTGTFGPPNEQESIRCSLAVTKSATPDRVSVNGKCAIAGGAVSIMGTMAYLEDRNRFAAVITSGLGGLKGNAVGRRSGNNVSYTLVPDDPEIREQFNVDASLSLKNESIVFDGSLYDKKTRDTTIVDITLDPK